MNGCEHMMFEILLASPLLLLIPMFLWTDSQ